MTWLFYKTWLLQCVRVLQVWACLQNKIYRHDVTFTQNSLRNISRVFEITHFCDRTWFSFTEWRVNHTIYSVLYIRDGWHETDVSRRCRDPDLQMFWNTQITWLKRFKGSVHFTSVSRCGMPVKFAFDWQGWNLYHTTAHSLVNSGTVWTLACTVRNCDIVFYYCSFSTTHLCTKS